MTNSATTTESPAPGAGELSERLTDLIAKRLGDTYHCTRVWSAWDHGTMSQADFEEVSQSETPAELATEILAVIAASSAVPQHTKGHADESTQTQGATVDLVVAGRLGGNPTHGSAEPEADAQAGSAQRQIEDCPELNLSNYDADDVDRLNDWAIRADAEIDRLRASLASSAGATVPTGHLVPVDTLKQWERWADQHYSTSIRDAIRTTLAAAPVAAGATVQAKLTDERIEEIAAQWFLRPLGKSWLDFAHAIAREVAPVQAKTVRTLADEQIASIWEGWRSGGSSWPDFARAVLAKFCEVNSLSIGSEVAQAKMGDDRKGGGA